MGKSFTVTQTASMSAQRYMPFSKETLSQTEVNVAEFLSNLLFKYLEIYDIVPELEARFPSEHFQLPNSTTNTGHSPYPAARSLRN